MGDADESAEGLILTIEGEHVALGPLRRELIPLYQRWMNNLGTMRTLDLTPYPITMEKEQDWYERVSRAESDVSFTIYERETLRPIGNTGLHEVDYRNRTASPSASSSASPSAAARATARRRRASCSTTPSPPSASTT